MGKKAMKAARRKKVTTLRKINIALRKRAIRAAMGKKVATLG